MNFTREPIIETVITPREGCKLVLRSSKGVGQEDYFVDAVEVVSFGSSIFYRSLERPKSFLLPVSDYEVLELKETRMVLKNASVERSIKIGGGSKEKEVSSTEPKEPVKQKRRTRRRKTTTKAEKAESQKQEVLDEKPKDEKPEENQLLDEGGDNKDETDVSSPLLSKLLPPPPTLIKEKLSKFKDQEILDANLVEEKLKDPLDEPAHLENETPQEDIPPPEGSEVSSKEEESEEEISDEATKREAESEPLDESAHPDKEEPEEVKEDKGK